ncbi:gluconokinase [Nocardioides sp. GCM10027113]|uniref:gluconokinase n=1 Tax=unclassified Nocardioides TaxID=2615069 RepID=UPI003611884D
MTPTHHARHLVVMGVSGTGKTTVAEALASRLGLCFVEGDSLHPEANITKMSAGTPLDDDDRRPWLETLAGLLASHHADGVSTVLTCSALKRSYRDVLRSRVPAGTVGLVHLTAPFEVLRERMEARDHFMPASLLQSQLDTLEALGPDEPGTAYDVTRPLDHVVTEVVGKVAPFVRGAYRPTEGRVREPDDGVGTSE